MITSAPWYITRRGNGPIVCGHNATLLGLNSGVTCLDIVARTDWGRGAEDEANARLIAAAPDLLLTLKRFTEIGARPTIDDLKEARALVEKVEG